MDGRVNLHQRTKNKESQPHHPTFHYQPKQIHTKQNMQSRGHHQKLGYARSLCDFVLQGRYPKGPDKTETQRHRDITRMCIVTAILPCTFLVLGGKKKSGDDETTRHSYVTLIYLKLLMIMMSLKTVRRFFRK